MAKRKKWKIYGTVGDAEDFPTERKRNPDGFVGTSWAAHEAREAEKESRIREAAWIPSEREQREHEATLRAMREKARRMRAERRGKTTSQHGAGSTAKNVGFPS